jgi:hypothetical protein
MRENLRDAELNAKSVRNPTAGIGNTLIALHIGEASL